MNYITTKLFAFLTIFGVIGIIVSSIVLCGFDIWWLVTGEMPPRLLFLQITTIITLFLQLIAFLTITTKKT